MQVLILTPEYDGSGGGIMTFYQALVPALQAQGVAVRVIEGSACNTAQEPCIRSRNGATVETLELSRLHRWHARCSHLSALPGLRRHLAAAWAMWEQANFGEGADVIEASDWGLLFVAPALDSTCPLLVQCHGSIGQIAERDPIIGEETQDRLTRLLERAILAEVDTVQTYSWANAAYWQNLTGRSVLMSRPAWNPPTERATQEFTNRGLVVGRVQRWKGPQDVCAAVRLLGNRAPYIDWVGRDTPFAYRNGSTARYLSKTYPGIWANKVIHHAPITAEKVRSSQAAALFNLVPSSWDVFNFTAVEAMASGRPTVASTGAGASELIEDGINGYTFPAGNPEKLAAAIDRVLCQTPTTLADIGRAAQATVRSALAPETMATERITAYRSTIHAARENHRPLVYAWLDEICRPTTCHGRQESSFLDQVPLRTLVRHVGGRLADKVPLRSREWAVR